MNMVSNEVSAMQRLVDRMVSDAARDMVSDLVVRALGLSTTPSARVFADDAVKKDLGGMDDTAHGTVALTEDIGETAMILKGMDSLETFPRAGAWNAVAMGLGPGDPWYGGDKLHLDDEPLVRFFQYKALARLATTTSLAEIKSAADTEGESILTEFLKDTLASSGVGLPRTKVAL